MGIVLDTFLVRTVTVPAIAAIVGRANRWPSRFRPRRHAPVRRTERVPTHHRLTSGNGGQRTRVAVPSFANRHRHRAHQTDEDFPHHALPPFSTNGVPKQPTTNGLGTVLNGQIPPADGEQLAEAKGQHPVGTNGERSAEANGERPVEEPAIMTADVA